MKETASCTVARLATSSSGMRTSNFSSASVTMVIIDSGSMPRSSVKDFSGRTESAGRPVSSLTISDSPARISRSLCAMRVTPIRVGVRGLWCFGNSVGQDGPPPGAARLSGQSHDLCGVGEPGAETDLQGQGTGLVRALALQPLGGERDGGRGGVAGLGDVARDDHRLRQPDPLGQHVDDAHVGLVREEHLDVLRLHPGGLDRGGGRLGHLEARPLEDGGPLLAQRGPRRVGAVLHGEPRVGHVHGVGLGAVRPPHRGADRRRLGRADDGGARAVAQDEGDRAVGGVDDVGHALGADDEDVVGGAGADERVGLGDAVAVAGARGGDVVGGGGGGADGVGDPRGERRRRLHVGDGRDDDRAELRALDPGGRQRPAGGLLGHRGERLLLGGPAPLDDPGALPDPLVGAVDRADDVVVGHHAVPAHAADPEDAGVGRALGRAEGGAAHRVAPCSRTSSRAASIWSGVFRARVCTPGSVRRARPVRTPAGASSTAAVTPVSSMVAQHRSHRTGRATWATIRSRASTPEGTGAPSALDSSVARGSAGDSRAAASRTAVTAGAMCSVWKAPATCSGTTRARAGGLAARAASWARVPAATTWPPPLTLAAVRPCELIASLTSSASPPTTALMPVGVVAAASAIARPRTPTSVIASRALSTPAAAAAASSPTEWPAVTSTGAVSSPSSACSARSEAATMSGWAFLVSRMVSASASVPRWRRSSWAASLKASRVASSPGSSSQGLSMPGVCAP